MAKSSYLLENEILHWDIFKKIWRHLVYCYLTLTRMINTIAKVTLWVYVRCTTGCQRFLGVYQRFPMLFVSFTERRLIGIDHVLVHIVTQTATRTIYWQHIQQLECFYSCICFGRNGMRLNSHVGSGWNWMTCSSLQMHQPFADMFERIFF